VSKQCEYVRRERCSRYGAKPITVAGRERYLCWQHMSQATWTETPEEQQIVARWLVPVGGAA
jgi:hypothetical protein